MNDILWRATPDTFGYVVSRASGSQPFESWPYIQYIGQRIARAVARGGGRLVINIPPGHGKSTLLSFWTPIWLLDNLPEQRVICSSHGAELAMYWGRLVRNEFDRNPVLTTRLREDSTAANRWNTRAGGGMVTTGVFGGITGFRGNLILIDDPYPTWEEAYSLNYRRKVIEWFDGTLYDRKEPGATIVLLMHRWHDEDLSGYLIQKHSDPWEVIRLPALAEKADPLGRAEGEALCPTRYSRDALLSDRNANPLVFEAKFQQNPMGIGTERVYDRYIPAMHDDKSLTLVRGSPLHVSFDFNRNPGMHVELGQYFYDKDLFTCCHEIFAPFLKLKPALELLKKYINESGGMRWPEIQVFADATGKADRAETTETALDQIVNFMRREKWPFRMRVPRDNPPQLTRIDTFNEALVDGDGDVHYKVNPLHCPRLIADLKTLKTDELGLIDKNDAKLSHASDAEGYRVHYLRPIRRLGEQGRKRAPRTVLAGR